MFSNINIWRQGLVLSWLLMLIRSDTVMPSTGNMQRIDKVCLTLPEPGQRNKLSGKFCSVVATVYGNSNSLDSMCDNLTYCHSPKAFEWCKMYKKGPATAAEHFIEEHMSSLCAQHGTAESFPLLSSRRMSKVPAMTLTGNIGHDLYNTILDVYAQQERQKKNFDALYVDVGYFGGVEKWLSSLSDRRKSWTLNTIEALFNHSSATGLSWGVTPSMKGATGAQSFLLGETALCIDEFWVKGGALMAENIGWDGLHYMPKLRKKVLVHYFGKGAAMEFLKRAKGPASPLVVTLYTRKDASRRRFADAMDGAILEQMKARLGVSVIVQKMPLDDPKQQVLMYAKSDVFIAPFGSNTANSVFMKPGSIFIEVSTLCPSLCLEGCHPYSIVGPGDKFRSMSTQMDGILQSASCSNLMADGPPLHYATGVNYHIISQCKKHYASCRDGKVFSGQKLLTAKKAWKKDFNNNLDLVAASDMIIGIIKGVSRVTNRTLAAPFDFRCPTAKAWL
jgi:hypothetical protein